MGFDRLRPPEQMLHSGLLKPGLTLPPTPFFLNLSLAFLFDQLRLPIDPPLVCVQGPVAYALLDGHDNRRGDVAQLPLESLTGHVFPE